MAIEVREQPVEAHNSVGKVERYHALLPRAYEIIRLEDPSTPRDAALQMAVKAINDSAGPDGLTPTLLVFGAYPRLTNDSTAALHQRNGPDTLPTLNLPLLSKVRVWREKQGWQGPYTLLSIEDEGCILQLPHGPRRFRSTAVKPYHDNDEDLSATPNDLPDETEPGAPPRTTQDLSPNIAATDDIAHDGASKVVDSIALPTRRRGRPRKS
ncbi:hypothetical protein K3495_g8334 [Podosphaera aphanis]|nr:hypothetical protein K3495_g8334 [Podosphaera aphanis]